MILRACRSRFRVYAWSFGWTLSREKDQCRCFSAVPIWAHLWEKWIFPLLTGMAKINRSTRLQARLSRCPLTDST